MKPGTLAAFLDVSEATVRDMERRGIIPKRNPLLGVFDSEAVVAALAKYAGGEKRTDAEEATIRTLEKLSGAPKTRGRDHA
jgi:hypothetical protein